MSWQTGTSDNYQDLLDQLVKIVTSDHVDSATINNGGTGYTVGDVLTATGGTFTHAATFIVTTIGGGGAITAVRLFEGGAYTSQPSSPVSTTGGTGTGATVNVTFEDAGWTLKQRTSKAQSATVQAGGTGYTVGDDITIVGGFGVTTAAVFNVDTVGGGGAITAVSLVTAGLYENFPANPASVTGGTGTGATLNVTWVQATTGEIATWLEGGATPGFQGAKPTVGIATFQASAFSGGGATVYNWACLAAANFNAGLHWYEQPNISPGVSNLDGSPDTNEGAFMPLKTSDAFDMNFWLSHTDRRIVLVAKVRNGSISHYASMYLGFMNPFGTADEFPYPIFVAASTARYNTLWTDTQMRFTGIVELVGISGFEGPAFFRKQDLTWQFIQNSDLVDSGSPTRTTTRDFVCFPAGETQATTPDNEDTIINQQSTLTFITVIPSSGVPGVATYSIQATPKTGGDVVPLIPATVAASDLTSEQFEVLGELDGVFWCPQNTGVNPEDSITDSDGIVHRVFKNGNRNEAFTLMSVKEA